MEKTKQTNLGESKTQEINRTKRKASSRISRLIAKKTFLKWHVSKKKRYNGLIQRPRLNLVK